MASYQGMTERQRPKYKGGGELSALPCSGTERRVVCRPVDEWWDASRRHSRRRTRLWVWWLPTHRRYRAPAAHRPCWRQSRLGLGGRELLVWWTAWTWLTEERCTGHSLDDDIRTCVITTLTSSSSYSVSKKKHDTKLFSISSPDIFEILWLTDSQ